MEQTIIKHNQHLDFILKIIREKYKLNVFSIKRLKKVEDRMFSHSFIYVVELYRAHPSLDCRPALGMPTSQPGTVTIPDSTRTLIMRLGNTASRYNHRIRVQNEVASMSLARKIFAPRKIIPDVYGWGSAAEGQGWILMEYMIGVPLGAELNNLTNGQRIAAVKEVARLVLALQQYKLPPSIKKFGGLDFDPNDNLVSAPLTLYHSGPFGTYSLMFRAMMREKLDLVDKSSVIHGGKESGRDNRRKLERFMAANLLTLPHSIELDRRLVHGKMSMSNSYVQSVL